MSRKKDIAVFAIQSFNDPLFYGLMYQYILQYNLKNESVTRFHVFTEEHDEFKLDKAREIEFKEELLNNNIFWYPLKYRKGRFLLLKKLYSILVFILKLNHVKRRYGIKVIIGFLTVAGSYSLIVSKLLKINLATFCFEPHSEYMIDFDTWSRNSLKYRITSWLEKLQTKNSKIITAPTIHTVELLKKWGVKAEILNVPISVDTDTFRFSEDLRTTHRTKLNVLNRYVLLYLGKFNGIYYKTIEVADFCSKLIKHNPKLFILIISPDPKERITEDFFSTGMNDSDFKVIDAVPYDEIVGYISASDIGLVSIPPYNSQKYRTPVKIGNYLSCGMPYIITKGIADDDILAERENVGVVFNSLTEEDNSLAFAKLDYFIKEEKNTQRTRCRNVAIKRRGIQNSIQALEKIINELG